MEKVYDNTEEMLGKHPLPKKKCPFKLGGIYGPDYSPPPNSEFAFRRRNTIVDMTAIAAVFLPEGFVIGADGLRQTTSKSKVTEEGQKVFRFTNDKITLAYAWCGHTVVWNEDDHSQVFFDFSKETDLALKDSLVADNLKDFSYKFCSLLQTRLNYSNWVNNGWVADFPGEKMARMLIGGYFSGQPFVAEIEVTQKSLMPSVSAIPLIPETKLRAFSGCRHVTVESDLTREPQNTSDARNLVHKYIQRCIDNPQCDGIGGRIHIALVTSDSFAWLDPPVGYERPAVGHPCGDPKQNE
jgi:hypothetical protein